MKLSTFIYIALLCFMQSGLSQAGDVVATVNDVPLKKSLVDFTINSLAAGGVAVNGDTRNKVIEEFIANELVVQEAQRIGIDKRPDYLSKLAKTQVNSNLPEALTKNEFAQRSLLEDTFIQDYYNKNPISESDTKAAYLQYLKELGDTEYSACHILLKTEAEAKDVIQKLVNGGNYAKIAKEKSLDPGSKDRGGDLGWFTPAGMVKPFSDAVLGLKKGEITVVPVQTQFGWHVIKLLDFRTTVAPSYDKEKDRLQKILMKRKLEKMVAYLRSKATVIVTSTANAGSLNSKADIKPQQATTYNPPPPVSAPQPVQTYIAPTTSYQPRNEEERQCLSFGFKPNTDGFGNCMLQLSQAKQNQIAYEEAATERKKQLGLKQMECGLNMMAGRPCSGGSNAPAARPPAPFIIVTPRGNINCTPVGNGITNCN
jgi:peptidyl-prolyl cis-trans isomerase C